MQRHHNNRLLSTFRRITAHTHAARQRQTQEGLRHFIFTNEIINEPTQSFAGKWDFDFQKPRAALKPLQVLLPTKWPAIRDAHRLKQAVAIEKTAVENR